MRARSLAWGAWFVWALLTGLATLLAANSKQNFPSALIPAFVLGAFMTVGAVVVSRQPRNTVGWLCCAAGLFGALAGFTTEYAGYALGPQQGSLPGGVAMAWLNMWLVAIWVGLAFTFLPLLFPTGRLPSPRWRPVAWACAIGLIALTAVLAAMPGPMEAVPGQPRNPLGIESAGPTLERIETLVNVCLALLVVLCAASVVVRFRQARGVERQQLKWFAYGAGQLALLLGSALVFPGLWDRVPLVVSDLLVGISFAMIPVAIGIAILRYRLYDIDRLIHRTLVYGLLTALLTVVYAGLVLGLGQLFDRVGTEPPSWAIAGATLAVAACSNRRVAASSRPWIGGSTGAATTPPRPSRPSAPACATRSTSTPSRPSCLRWSTRPCSRPAPRCGFDPPSIRRSPSTSQPRIRQAWGRFVRVCKTVDPPITWRSLNRRLPRSRG